MTRPEDEMTDAELAAIRVIRAEDKYGGITGETLRRLLARLDAITAERDRLRGEVERLTAERDAAYARGVEDAARAAGHAEIDAPNIAGTYDRLMAEHAEKLRDAVVAAIRALAPGGAT